MKNIYRYSALKNSKLLNRADKHALHSCKFYLTTQDFRDFEKALNLILIGNRNSCFFAGPRTKLPLNEGNLNI